MYVYVDDIRDPPFSDPDVLICRTYAEAIKIIVRLSNANQTFVLDLDHDLGEEKTGYDISKFIVENKIMACKHIKLHTQNPVGRANMRQLLSHYGYDVD